MNWIEIIFSMLTLNIVIPGLSIIFVENYVPQPISVLFCYGKFARKHNNQSLTKLEVPKRYFQHFYVFAFVWNWLILLAVFWNSRLPETLQYLVSWLCGAVEQNRLSGNDGMKLSTQFYLAQTALCIQCSKRLYEVYCVSVFAKNSRINLFHYAVGYFHYFGASIAILSHSLIHPTENELQLGNIHVVDAVAFLAIFYTLYKQFESNRILSAIRRDSLGTVITEKYRIPCGGLFEYVSSPHLFTEVLFYLLLAIILRSNSSWYYVVVWVTSNQMVTACLSHRWYQSKFKDYPKQRKILIPFIL